MSEIVSSNYSNIGFNNLKLSPTFKSDNVTTPETENDKVELSTKQDKNEKKFGMSKGMKILLGIGGLSATLYAGLVTHNALTKPSLEKLAKDFSEIFRREVSSDEVPQMIKEYKELFKINDAKEFCQKTFDQVKKDYGYKDLDIKLTLNEATDGILAGGWKNNGEEFSIYYKKVIEVQGGKFDRTTKISLLKTIFHEFQHVKQTEYSIRTDAKKYCNSIIQEDVINKGFIKTTENLKKDENWINKTMREDNVTREDVLAILDKQIETLKTKGYRGVEEYKKAVEVLTKSYQSRLEKLFGKYEKFKPEAEEYKKGESYIENFGNYIEPSVDEKKYLEQTVEKEANHAGDLSMDIPKRLKSIWSIF